MANTKVLKQIKKLKIRRPRLKMFRTPAFRALFMHHIVLMALFAGVTFFARWEEWLFISICIPLFLLGCLHTWLIYIVHDWSERIDGLGWKEALFTFLLNLSGAIAIYTVISKVGDFKDYASILALSSLIFSLPFVWDKAIQSIMHIPEKVYPPLILESLENIRGKVAIEPNPKGIIWEFENPTEVLPTNPVRMYMPLDAGKLTIKALFKVFLLYYNTEISPENPIPITEIKEETLRPKEWFLFHKPFGFLAKSILNPEETIHSNRISFKKIKTKNNQGHEVNIKVIHIYVRLAEETPISEPENINQKNDELNS